MVKQDVSHFNSKQRHILNSALDLLAEVGSKELTMRKIAERAGTRLSNVQYYFKSRDDVLKAMVLLYFEYCTDRLEHLISTDAAHSERERLHALILDALRQGEQISDMCRTFRELWAISSRNTVIHSYMMEYYSKFADVMAAHVFGDRLDRETKQKVISLLVPYSEGYSVTAQSLSLGSDAIAEMLTDLAMQIATPTISDPDASN